MGDSSGRIYNIISVVFLLLTVGVYADRTRQPYGDVIAPDEELPPGLSNDEVMARVQAWLLGQNACMSK